MSPPTGGISRRLASSVRYSPAVTKSTPIECCRGYPLMRSSTWSRVAVVLLVALHRHRPRRPWSGRARAPRACPCPRSSRDRRRPRRAPRRSRAGARAAPPRAAASGARSSCCSSFSSSAPEISVPVAGIAHDARFGRALDQVRFELALVLDVGLRLAALDAEERRLRDVDVAVLDDASAAAGRRTSAAGSGCASRPRPRRS